MNVSDGLWRFAKIVLVGVWGRLCLYFTAFIVLMIVSAIMAWPFMVLWNNALFMTFTGVVPIDWWTSYFLFFLISFIPLMLKQVGD